MTDAATAQTMTAAEYLEWERQQADKHEFHHGEVFAAQNSDQRIAAEPMKRYVYADVVLVCGTTQFEPEARDVLTNPSVIVEVPSPSTENYDRGVKWKAYQRLSSLTDYLLVSQTEPLVEHYRREADGSWRYLVYEAGDTITLANQAQLAIDPIYRGVFELEAF